MKARGLRLELRADRALRLLWIPLLAGGALRFWFAGAHLGVAYPDLARDESYYETGISALSCGLWAIPPEQTPSSHLAPALPAFVAAVEAPFAVPSPGRARLAQAALSTLTVALVYFAGAAALSPLAGLLAACWAAFDPEQIRPVASLNVHAYYAFALVLLAAAGLRWLARGDRRSTIQFGFALASSLLARVVHFPFVIFLIGAAVLWKGRRAPGVRRASWVLVSCALFLTPFSVRNRLQFGRWSPFDGKGAYLLLAGTVDRGDQATIDQALDAAERSSPGFRARGLQGEALERALVGLAFDNIRRDPVRWFGSCVDRFVLFWSGLWPYWVLGLLALIIERRSRGLWLVSLAAAALSGYAVAGGAPIYRAAALPLLSILGGAGAAALLSFDKGPRPGGPVMESVVGSRTLDAALVVAFAVYGTAVVLSIRELERYPVRTAQGPVVPSPACTDGRALSLLKTAALADREGTAAKAWLSALDRAVGEESAGAGPKVDRHDFDLYLTRHPEDPDGWRGRGVLKGLRGDAPGAARDFRRALALRPSDLEAVVSLASLPAPYGGSEETRRLARRALELSPARRGEPVYARAEESSRPSR